MTSAWPWEEERRGGGGGMGEVGKEMGWVAEG